MTQERPVCELDVTVRVMLPRGLSGRLQEATAISSNSMISVGTDSRALGAELREKLDEAQRAVLLQFERLLFGDPAADPSATQATLADDPERLVNEGAEDPLDGEISDEPCGAKTQVGPNSWNQVTCDREPHPKAWLHIAVVDDLVEHVWRDPLPEELPLLKVTSEGVQYSCCGWLVSADGTHESTCKTGGEDREPEEPQQP